MKKQNPIDWTKKIVTRGGSDYRLYEVFYEDYCNGSYYDEDSDVWWPVQHSFNGRYADKPSSLDLVNV